jgi:multidrug resistance efflux pump
MKNLLSRLISKQGDAPSGEDRKLSDLEIQHRMLLSPPPIWSSALIWTLGLGSVALLGWSVINKIEETTSLPGQLETLRSETSIKSPDTAVVEAVKVRQFEDVTRNQILFVLSREDLAPKLMGLQEKQSLLDSRIQREQTSFSYRIQQAQEQISLNADILGRLTKLLKEGSVQEIQILEKKNELLQSKLSYKNLLEERQKSKINYEIESNDIATQLKELRQRSKQFSIQSPISGTLQKLAVQATGERVQAGDVLATVVPKEGLIAAVQVTSKLTAPIVPGKPAEITVDAFPSNDYGTLKGIVQSISPTTSSADAKGQVQAYVARIRIPTSGIPKDYPSASLRSGMGVTARVVLHKKPVISLVFDFVEDLFKPMSDRR